MTQPIKINYGRVLKETLENISLANRTPRLLLHACCAPCSSYVLEYLSPYFEIILYFYNPNISSQQEFDYRLSELQRLVAEMPLQNKVEIIVGKYESEKFLELAKGYENDRERGSRCQRCIFQRMENTYQLAKELKVDYFTTTLTISPHKDSVFINKIGEELAQENAVKYLFSDFKKNNGYKRSIEMSNQYSLYRQSFCGCIFSQPSDI